MYEENIKVDTYEKSSTEADRGTLLLIDDEPEVLRVMAMRLERMGHRVISTTDSGQALEMIRNEPGYFDVVVTDLAMPQIPGDRLAKEVFALRDDLPMVLCTGFSSTIDEHEARRLGFEAFLLKPVLGNELITTVSRCLDKRQGSPA